MSLVVPHPQAVVVELHDWPCYSHEDGEELQRVLALAGHSHVRLVIDCAKVQALGAPFLSVLLATMKRLGARVGDVVLCNLQPVPLQIFQVTGLDRVLPLCATREEAITAPWPDPEAYLVPAWPNADHVAR
jgi:anti-anti-sigma factor